MIRDLSEHSIQAVEEKKEYDEKCRKNVVWVVRLVWQRKALTQSFQAWSGERSGGMEGIVCLSTRVKQEALHELCKGSAPECLCPERHSFLIYTFVLFGDSYAVVRNNIILMYLFPKQVLLRNNRKFLSVFHSVLLSDV